MAKKYIRNHSLAEKGKHKRIQRTLNKLQRSLTNQHKHLHLPRLLRIPWLNERLLNPQNLLVLGQRTLQNNVAAAMPIVPNVESNPVFSCPIPASNHQLLKTKSHTRSKRASSP